jgi:hypothetical protein
LVTFVTIDLYPEKPTYKEGLVESRPLLFFKGIFLFFVIRHDEWLGVFLCGGLRDCSNLPPVNAFPFAICYYK